MQHAIFVACCASLPVVLRATRAGSRITKALVHMSMHVQYARHGALAVTFMLT